MPFFPVLVELLVTPKIIMLPHMMTRVAKHRPQPLLDIIVPLVIAAAASMPLFYHVVVLAPKHPDNYRTFYSFAAGRQDYSDLKAAWQPRLLSNLLAAQFGRISATIMDRIDLRYSGGPQAFTVALWTVTWFVCISIIYTVYFGRRALFYILGTYAAISFGYIDKLPLTRVYPWDLPALLVYAAFMVLFLSNRFKWILLLLPVGMAFKETAGILCLAFLLADGLPARSRLWMFGVALVACATAKIAIGTYVGSLQPLFTMEYRLGYQWTVSFFTDPWMVLGALRPLLVDAGLLASFILIPSGNSRVLALKWLVVPFALGNLLFGNLQEYRIWFELTPFALFGLETAIYSFSGDGQFESPGGGHADTAGRAHEAQINP